MPCQLATPTLPSGDALPGCGLTLPSLSNDLSRPVYCVLGIPIDAVEMPAVLRQIEVAAAERTRLDISTPNVNFLVLSRLDAEFRESLFDSDLCPADGMPIVWIARLIGAPITTRVSGSDIFEALKRPNNRARSLRIFFFGGEKGIAALAAQSLNQRSGGLECVGSFYPGVGAIDDLSTDQAIDTINASGADILAVSLGSKKGQLWLQRNRLQLTVAIRCHLGAVINFEAGTVKRAPSKMRGWGLEWLWRIKEEPSLWRRYAYDGVVLLRLLITRVLPLVALNGWHRLRSAWTPQQLAFNTTPKPGFVILAISGDAVKQHIDEAIIYLGDILRKRQGDLLLDLSRVRLIDARFIGFLLLVRKQLNYQGRRFAVEGVSPAIRQMFQLHGVDFLLDVRIEND